MADNVICKCPKCEGELRRIRYIKDDKELEFIGCSNFKEKGCKYSVPTAYFDTKLSDEVIKQLIENGKTNKPISIKVNLKLEDGKVRMDFSK
ncbi:hypothetical protein [Alkaliphilus sp. B6464]|uniref:hypothetical protein n=1 Tax=Alkaliphilus sp. B6464 TaxID=2731219 RepID=UPI001BAAF6F7|nr:hypothetical protein [Alkaliphilus sp. B6464]QUH22009.1 hypothetical protein HYG84_19075 [Alkaliphilus sp. B6464]